MNIVKRSLYLCIGLLLALVAGMGIQSLWQVSSLSDTVDAIGGSARLAKDAGELWDSFTETDTRFKAAAAFTDSVFMAADRAAFLESAKQLSILADGIRGRAHGELRGVADEAAQQLARWSDLATQHLSSAGTTTLPSYHLLEEARSALKSTLGQLVERSAQHASAMIDEDHRRARSALAWTIAELLAALALGFGTGGLALRGLRRQLGGEASDVAAVANAVADGDLTVRISTADVPPGSVMAATARMQQSLIATVGNVLAISQRLSSSAGDIADSNGHLSRRTEQQADALERTASTMEQLGATVRHNADNVGRATESARSASVVAAQGGAMMEKVIRTMEQIDRSSKRIADFINQIEGIAFQTNILALNAAVESARAGEQGRGFAVVAAEVRSLSQLCSAAAKEIKSLITASVEQVEQGTQLVNETGSTMQQVVGAIQHVTEVISEINGTTAQQSAGMHQVANAMSEIDHGTQQNAMLAQQSAQGAEDLKSQARQLLAAVSAFKV